jgi:hypothetical protein
MNENKNMPWKAFLGCGGISLFFIVVVVLGITLACIATVAVPLLNREVLQDISCPPGMTLVTGWEETSYSEPGEKVLYGYCVDSQGNQTEVQDLGYGALEYFPLYFLFSLAASFVLTLLVVIPLILLFRFIRRRFFSKKSPPSAISD